MSDFKARVIGLPGLHAKLKALPEKIKKEVKDAVNRSALDLQNDIKVSMARWPKTGETYKHHRASAPGEPPAVDLGRLISHISYETDLDGLGASVGAMNVATVKYAQYLEFGTKNMAPRPWLQPAFEKNRDEITRRISKAVAAGIKKISKRK